MTRSANASRLAKFVTQQRAEPIGPKEARDSIAKLPEPRTDALYLPEGIKGALMRSLPSGGLLRASCEADAKNSRTYGYCEVRGLFLTNFECSVRNELAGDIGA